MRPLKQFSTDYYPNLQSVKGGESSTKNEEHVKGVDFEKLLGDLSGLFYQFQYFPDTNKSCFPFVSKGIDNIYEVNSEDLKIDASPAISRIHRKDIDRLRDIFNSSVESLSSWNIEYRVILPIKGLRWLRGQGKPERLKDGSILWSGHILDITDQKIQEELNLNAINKVEDQNSRLLNFAHIVSHNLRTHSGNFESLLEMTDDTENIDEKLEMISYLKKVSHGLSDTISHLNEIVDVQNNTETKLTTVNIHDYVENVIAVFKKDIDCNRVIINNKVPKTLSLQYNACYMDSILLNLISNGIKYRHEARIPEINIETYTENKKTILKVSDNGIGIDLSKYGKDLFGMYKTFHNNKDAKGIGLFITKNQIEALGDEIKVESDVNIGTSFSVHFNNKGVVY